MGGSMVSKDIVYSDGVSDIGGDDGGEFRSSMSTAMSGDSCRSCASPSSAEAKDTRARTGGRRHQRVTLDHGVRICSSSSESARL